MRFKRKHNLRDVAARQKARREKLDDMRDMPGPGLTVILNGALDRAMVSDIGTTERVWACLARTSWGNWCAYSVDRGGPAFSNPDAIDGLLDIFYGSPLCPYCAKPSERQTGIPDGWRWHMRCMQMAYAKDAVKFGNDQQRDWGRNVLLGTAPYVPVMLEQDKKKGAPS
jgi:hypothetical protein